MIQINGKKGFTLVELLAVIVILAIILVIAVPKVMSIIEDAKKGTLESTAKMIASQAEKQKVQNTVLGNDKAITCESITNINKEDYPSCEITFEDNTAKVTIVGGGKFEGLNICGGTKTDAIATKEECCGAQKPTGLNCTFEGELEQGAEYVNGQYTYRYKQEFYYDDPFNIWWNNIENDGWGVTLTDKESTEPANTPICTYINGKPLVSTSFMFTRSAATSIDLSSLDTSNVTSMESMFRNTVPTILDLRGFDTSNVTNMRFMFAYSPVTSLDLSSFDTSNVTDMQYMFNYMPNIETIYVSDKWNISNIESHSYMFTDVTNLVGGNGTAYNSSYTDKTYARIDKEGEPGYFTYKASN